MADHERQHAFNKPTADIILRSSDAVDFRVHKLILSEASPVFEGMFSIPQPAPSASDPSTVDGLAVVPFAETGATLTLLFEICYPMPDPALDTLQKVDDVLAAALKYDIDAALALARTRLVDPHLLKVEPFMVYAVASRHQLRAETEEAMKATLETEMPKTFTDAFAAMTPAALFCLTQYRAACVFGVLQYVLDSKRWEELIGKHFALHFHEDSGPAIPRPFGQGYLGYICEDCLGLGKWESGTELPPMPVDLLEFQKGMVDVLGVIPCGAALRNRWFVDRSYLASQAIEFQGHGCKACHQFGVACVSDIFEEFSHDIDGFVIAEVMCSIVR